MNIKPVKPGPGQESCWDYPRPPALDTSNESIVIELGGMVIARSTKSWRVLETSHPPTYYVPRAAFVEGALRLTTGATWCEWKGKATYYDLVAGDTVVQAGAWNYPEPTPRFADLSDAISLMPAVVDRITINNEVVTPQEGTFYGGWITSRVVGPFKGAPGTSHW